MGATVIIRAVMRAGGGDKVTPPLAAAEAATERRGDNGGAVRGQMWGFRAGWKCDGLFFCNGEATDKLILI